jgi:hypothetical protein
MPGATSQRTGLANRRSACRGDPMIVVPHPTRFVVVANYSTEAPRSIPLGGAMNIAVRVESSAKGTLRPEPEANLFFEVRTKDNRGVQWKAATTNALGLARVSLVALEHPGTYRVWLYVDKAGRAAVLSAPVTAPPMRLTSQKRPLRRWLAVALVLVIVGIGGLLVIRLRQPVEAVVTPVADAYVSTAHAMPTTGRADPARRRHAQDPQLPTIPASGVVGSDRSGGAAAVVPERRSGRLLGPPGDQQ